jgi:hypothetical protein
MKPLLVSLNRRLMTVTINGRAQQLSGGAYELRGKGKAQRGKNSRRRVNSAVRRLVTSESVNKPSCSRVLLLWNGLV